MLQVIIMATIAGCLGTGLGGVVGCIVKERERTMSALLGFAGGVMLGVVLLDLLPESLKISNIYITLLSMIAGVVAVYVLGDVLTKRLKMKNAAGQSGGKDRYILTGMMIFASIAMHDFPEGLVIGAGEAASIGIVHTLLIALHNIPEGMAVALPMKKGGLKSPKIILYSVLSGLPSFFGAIVGYALGGVHVIITAICLSFSAGAMLAVVFSELLPAVNEMSLKKNPNVAVSIIVGIIATLIMVSVLN